MAKKLVSLLLALTLAVVCGAALAETTTTTGVAYGVYSNEGEHPDSLIRVTLTLDNGAITAAELDEKLIPVAMGGAAGWAELTDETAALLGDAVIEANDKKDVYKRQPKTLVLCRENGRVVCYLTGVGLRTLSARMREDRSFFLRLMERERQETGRSLSLIHICTYAVNVIAYDGVTWASKYTTWLVYSTGDVLTVKSVSSSLSSAKVNQPINFTTYTTGGSTLTLSLIHI